MTVRATQGRVHALVAAEAGIDFGLGHRVTPFRHALERASVPEACHK